MIEKGSRIDALIRDQIPTKVMDWFEGRSAMSVRPGDYKTGNFIEFYIIHHQSGDTTYIARQKKTYDTSGDTEDLVHLIDLDSNGNEEGHAEIRNNITNPSPYFRDKPFVGYTKTEDMFRNRGLATRRLLIMNQITRMFYGLELHSDTLITKEARGLWERLVGEGKAIKYKEGELDRFKFV